MHIHPFIWSTVCLHYKQSLCVGKHEVFPSAEIPKKSYSLREESYTVAQEQVLASSSFKRSFTHVHMSQPLV